MGKNDGDLVDFLMKSVFQLFGWIFLGIFRLLWWILSAIFKGIVSLCRKSEPTAEELFEKNGGAED